MLLEALAQFANKLAPSGELNNWLFSMSATVTSGRAHTAQTQASRTATHERFNDALRLAKDWHRVFVFAPCDKLKHNKVAICPNAYATALC